MTKISPIALYLTQNKAITKKTGNVCNFFSREGLYLGRQIKLSQGNSTAYVREILGEGLKRLFYECKVLSQKCVYYKDDTSPVGLNIMPTHSYILTHSIDFLTNKVKSVQSVRTLTNRAKIIAIDENVQVGIYDIHKPFIFEERVIESKQSNLSKNNQIQHTIH